jgi:hypothetical protein
MSYQEEEEELPSLLAAYLLYVRALPTTLWTHAQREARLDFVAVKFHVPKQKPGTAGIVVLFLYANKCGTIKPDRKCT